MAPLTRILVIASMLLAVAAGLWPLAPRPGLLATLAGVFVGAGAMARWQPGPTTAVVLLFAYVSYGAARLIGGIEVASMPFFLAGFAGLTVGLASWTEWQARVPWRVPLAWWAVGVAVTWPFFAARDLGYSLAPSLAAGPVITTALLQMSLALWMDRLLREPPAASFFRFRDDDLPLRSWHVPLMLSALATAVAALYQHRVDLTWLSGDLWVGLGRAVGMTGDANPMGVATALWAPITAGAFATSAVSAVVGLLLALLLWLAAWASGARTTLILFAAGAAALTLMATSSWGWPRRRVVTAGAALGLVLLVSAAVLAPRVEPTTPIGRLLAALPKSSPSDAAYELLWRRDGYGLAAVAAIREHPLIGVGVGRFHALSTGYHQRLTGTAIPPDNAQNLWRQTLAEQGLLGLLPLLWLTGLTAISVFTGRADGLDLVLRVMIVGLGVSLLVGYPVQDPAIAVTLVTLVAVVARAERRT